MSVRDLGYRRYEGERLPSSQNISVLFRYGLKNAWSSWLVKLAVFFGWVPALIAVIAVGIHYYANRQMSAAGLSDAANVVPGLHAYNAGEWLQTLNTAQIWLFLSLVTLGAGAGAIAEDRTFNTMPFFFSKPVTPVQYMLGRVGAVSLVCFLLVFLPACVVVLVMAGSSSGPLMLERAGLVLPMVLQAGLIGGVMGVVSVGVSALSASRALTRSAWVLLFVVPTILAAIVELGAEWPWLSLCSLPSLLDTVGDALLKVTPTNDVRWYHALPVLAALTVGSGAYALSRLRKSEVFG